MLPSFIQVTSTDQVADRFEDAVTVLRFESVGPTIGREVTNRAALAVAVAAGLVVLYIIYSFRGVPNAFRYGVCAILAMLHDVAVIFSLTAIGGRSGRFSPRSGSGSPGRIPNTRLERWWTSGSRTPLPAPG